MPRHKAVLVSNMRGSHRDDLSVSALCSEKESHLHINLLELRAIRLALQSFLLTIGDKIMLALTDNPMAVHYQ